MKYQDLSSFKMPPNFRGRSKITVQLWWMIESTLFRYSPNVFYGWRRFLLRLFGAKIGKGVAVRASVEVTYPWKIEIGDNSWIGHDCTLYSLGKITIGKNVALAHKVYLNTGGHNYSSPSFEIFSSPLVIEDECWITNDVYIAPGVTIGRGAIVGARSTVLKDVPPGKIVVGSPAKIIKDRIIQ